VQELCSRDEWTTIHALARSQKETFSSKVVFDFIDLLGSVDDMAKQLENVRADYVFFSAYLQGSTEKEAWDLNGN
jgi:hypothetical protein